MKKQNTNNNEFIFEQSGIIIYNNNNNNNIYLYRSKISVVSLKNLREVKKIRGKNVVQIIRQIGSASSHREFLYKISVHILKLRGRFVKQREIIFDVHGSAVSAPKSGDEHTNFDSRG